jgi:hypothetical protein
MSGFKNLKAQGWRRLVELWRFLAERVFTPRRPNLTIE